MGYRYIGSKEKLAEEIIAIIRDNCPEANTAIDLMAGTGLFSLHLRQNGYHVLAADVMTYSYHHLVVNLLIDKNPLFQGLVEDGLNDYSDVIKYLNEVEPIKGYFYKEFSSDGLPTNGCTPRMYFTSNNAAKIDAIRQQIIEWNNDGKLSHNEHSLLLHDLIMATNDVANIAGTYGHYLSHYVARSMEPIKLSASSFEYNNNMNHQIFQGYAEDLCSNLSGDFCYIDPPYIKRQYAANYHILETIAREDFPEAVGQSGLRPWRDKYSNFCSKRKIKDSITKIISNIRTHDVFISYSEDGLMQIDDLVKLLRDFGTVNIYNINYKRFRSNASAKGLEIIEYLIHLRK